MSLDPLITLYLRQPMMLFGRALRCVANRCSRPFLLHTATVVVESHYVVRMMYDALVSRVRVAANTLGEWKAELAKAPSTYGSGLELTIE